MSFFLQIITSSNRRTIAIQVYQDCTVKIRVLVGLSQQKINDIITKKEGWINKKIQHFQKILPKILPKILK
jgi:predicted metal-dependent hydrolase